MEETQPHFLRKITALPIHAWLWVHAVAAGAFVWLQPRGFSFGSAPFFEHQVIVPALFLLAVATPVLVWFRPRLATFGCFAIGGFWIAISVATWWVGNTVLVKGMVAILAVMAGYVALVAAGINRRGESIPIPIASLLGGAALGALFLTCTWAPAATTRPSGDKEPDPPGTPAEAVTPSKTIALRWIDGHVTLRAGKSSVDVWPALEFDSISESGFWTIFDTRTGHTAPWGMNVARRGLMILSTDSHDLSARVRISVDGETVTIRCATTLKHELAAHLASSMRVRAKGSALIEGHPWLAGHESALVEFVAFRDGRLELLRSSSAEKGPFETIAHWPPRDPVLEIDGWSIQVRGWAEQGSHSESPTAGWGVSQAAIEKVGDEYLWSLASTSIGRGWHAVRTAAGTYVLEAVISRETDQ